MTETRKGLLADLHRIRYRIIQWLIKLLVGNRQLKSPIDVVWSMIDEENQKSVTYEDGPDCTKIEAWEEAIERIRKECFEG